MPPAVRLVARTRRNRGDEDRRGILGQCAGVQDAAALAGAGYAVEAGELAEKTGYALEG